MSSATPEERIYRLGDTDWTVTIEADRRFKSGVVHFQGFVAGRWNSPGDLRPQLDLPLSDGSKLTLRRVRARGFRHDLDIRRDGVPLVGSAHDPRRKVADAAGFLLFMASLFGLLGLVGLMAALESGWVDLPYAIAYFLSAGILFALGSRARRGSAAAFGAAIGLVTLNAIAQVRDTPGTSDIGHLVGALVLIALLTRGLVGARQLSQLKASAPNGERGGA